MENNLTLSVKVGKTFELAERVNGVLKTSKNVLMRAVQAPADTLCRYYSGIFEREVGRWQLFHLLHAQVAFVFAACPVDGPLLLRAVCCAWFGWAVMRCRCVMSVKKTL